MWRLLQLADAALPIGGFAHSGGLEAARPASVAAFAREVILAAAHGALPIVAAAHAEPARHAELDELVAALTWSHVAARASIGQGRALADVARRAFGIAIEAPIGHFAPAFGVVAARLAIARRDTLAAYLHHTARGVLSSGIRLGALGPLAAQRLQAELAGDLDAALELGLRLTLDDVAQVAPLVELAQATHDRLYSRLFQS